MEPVDEGPARDGDGDNDCVRDGEGDTVCDTEGTPRLLETVDVGLLLRDSEVDTLTLGMREADIVAELEMDAPRESETVADAVLDTDDAIDGEKLFDTDGDAPNVSEGVGYTLCVVDGVRKAQPPP